MNWDPYRSPVFEVAQQEFPDGATPLYMITVDEGWRTYILCTDMYEDKAEWLAQVLNDRGLKPGVPA